MNSPVMPKWIVRWVDEVKNNLPDCAARCDYSEEYFSFMVEIYYPRYVAWGGIDFVDWHYWAIRLNPSKSPSVRQNRRKFREQFYKAIRSQINSMSEVK